VSKSRHCLPVRQAGETSAVRAKAVSSQLIRLLHSIPPPTASVRNDVHIVPSLRAEAVGTERSEAVYFKMSYKSAQLLFNILTIAIFFFRLPALMRFSSAIASSIRGKNL